MNRLDCVSSWYRRVQRLMGFRCETLSLSSLLCRRGLLHKLDTPPIPPPVLALCCRGYHSTTAYEVSCLSSYYPPCCSATFELFLEGPVLVDSLRSLAVPGSLRASRIVAAEDIKGLFGLGWHRLLTRCQ